DRGGPDQVRVLVGRHVSRPGDSVRRPGVQLPWRWAPGSAEPAAARRLSAGHLRRYSRHVTGTAGREGCSMPAGRFSTREALLFGVRTLADNIGFFVFVSLVVGLVSRAPALVRPYVHTTGVRLLIDACD